MHLRCYVNKKCRRVLVPEGGEVRFDEGNGRRRRERKTRRGIMKTRRKVRRTKTKMMMRDEAV